MPNEQTARATPREGLLTTYELHEYFARLGLPEAGRRLVEKARREAPVREVQSRLGNVLSHYPSRKMGRTLVAESLHVEFPAFLQYEFDKDVLEYYPQPVMLDLRIVDPLTKKVSRIQHTPDVLLLRRDCVCIDEWKEQARLEKLAAKHPGRFTRDGTRWNCPLIESHLHEFGIQYRLRTADEHPCTLLQNLRFLADYYLPGANPVNEKVLARIRECLAKHGAIALSDLFDLGRATGPREVSNG